MRVAVITIAAGRKGHLARQIEGLQASRRRSDLHVVVALDQSQSGAIAAECPPGTEVVAVDGGHDRLMLAEARNAGAARALHAGADLLIFLDVDCIPGPDLIGRYAASAGELEPALLCGPVAYLPPRPRAGYAAARLHALGKPHPARPVPREDQVLRRGDHRLFWSLSFATSGDTWMRIGGFCEDYEGYGGEDTDFGQLAHRAGVELCWVGGAWAFHQHHATATPPTQHLDDILRNARLFHRRWGWWPMVGWLNQFAAAGLARYDSGRDSWTRV